MCLLLSYETGNSLSLAIHHVLLKPSLVNFISKDVNLVIYSHWFTLQTGDYDIIINF